MFLLHWHSSSTGADATDRGRRIHVIAPAFAFGAAPAVDRMEGTRTLRKNAQRTLTSAKHYQFARSNSVVPHTCPFSLTLKLTHLYTASPSRRPTPPHPVDRKEQKKVTKLEAQIPYHVGRGEKEEADKIQQKIDAIWAKAKEAAFAM